MEEAEFQSLREKIRRDLAGLPQGNEPAEFVINLGQTLDGIYRESARRANASGVWKKLESQLRLCTFNAWGEYRSVDTFARQILRLGYRYPELRLVVSQQMKDEMRHAALYRKAAIGMGGQDPFLLPKPSDLFRMMDLYDTVSEDVIETIFSTQFCSESGAVVNFEEQATKELHCALAEVVKQILPDEHFHVSIGRTAARILAEEGGRTRQKMLDLAALMVATTICTQEESGRSAPPL
jgi:hypothetical protein